MIYNEADQVWWRDELGKSYELLYKGYDNMASILGVTMIVFSVSNGPLNLLSSVELLFKL